VHHVIPFAAQRIGQELRLAREQIREKAHVVRVIGHDEKIERT
jgi:hypothetical protein